MSIRRVGLAVAVSVGSLAASATALEPKERVGLLDLQEFIAPELVPSSANVPLAEVLGELPNRAAWDTFLAERGDAAGEVQAFIDPRSGAASNLLVPFPLLPGDGVGNQITLDEIGATLGRPVPALDAATVAEVVYRFLLEHAAVLGIEPAELGPVSAVPVHDQLWQVSAPQRVGELPVRDARLVATIVHGNLVAVGTQTWGRVRLDPAPALDAEQALAAGFDLAGGRATADLLVRAPRLEVAPVAPLEHQAGEAFVGPVGAGYRHRLVWSFVFQREPDLANWEVLVDAHDGEVLALQDLNQYVQRGFTGGVYPTTSTEVCPTPGTCGIMQSGWPMPYANTGFASPNNFTNSAGIYDWTAGTATTTLDGRYFRMQDVCGAISASSATGNIDLLGSNGQHDCTTPGFGGAGNTSASRSGFYELNRIAEQARGWLPANSWLATQVTSNMNINNTCNAFWSPGAGTVNFYRSGGGCRNTGEIAGVFDHEWGHGMDDNDAGGTLSSSSEAYADIAMLYRLQTSCIGHGFFLPPAGSCGLTADGTGRNADEDQTAGLHCDTDCSGVRDADWARHNPNTPDTALGFVCSACLASSGPCGRQVHCAAAPSRQAAWDLVARDLPAAPFNYDSQSAFLVGSRIFYTGSGNIGLWHNCVCGSSSDGCGATNGYMQWLAADDDNGNLTDGTPHMTAIHAAFNRHGIACASPAPVNSGCAGGPTTAPTLTVTPGNYQNALSWNSVPGASLYWVMRTEGHAGCNFGKARIATVAGNSYVDTQVANGRTYYYNVVAQGSSPACYTRVSTCVAGTPQLTTYALTVAVTGSGTVTSAPPGIACPADCTEDYVDGTLVTLSQAADPGWVFTGWSGDCTGAGACQVTMSAARSVGATFVPLRTLTVAVTGSGTVTSAPPGIACPADCTEDYVDGTLVTLSQAADPGWVFTGWSGDCTGAGACQVTMSAARSVGATFVPLRTLTVAVTGSGTVTSAPPGIACPADCTEDYVDGTLVTLSQAADPGWVFTGWSGDCTGAGACQVTMSAARSVGATFVPLRTLTVAVTGSGTVTSAPPGIACPADCSEDYVDGTLVTLSQAADPGWVFTGWSGDCTGAGACQVTMSAARSVGATFVPLRTLTVAVTGSGTVTSAPPGIACPTDCSESFVDGTAVGLTAAPDPGSFFVGWSGDCTGTGACNLTMSAARSVGASFDTMPFLDGFETGNTSRWSSAVP
ncbi:MAG: endopeptidase [Thermoanaerobaculia bacterium]|nr:MAG: endopeptidase [Thermoanaerobaculia bacterium]